MPAPRLLPTSDALLQMRNQGWSYDRIAAEYGVSKGAVYLQLRQAKATKDRPSYRHLIPWNVKTEHAHTHPVTMLRLLGRRENGQPIPPAKERMLDKWLKELQEGNLVVCYHRDFPAELSPDNPNSASPKVGGFHYSTRKPEDGDALIRQECNHHSMIVVAA